MAVYTKKWNGSAWVTAPFKKWNGSAWVDAYVYKWTGSNWFQLYPEPQVAVSGKQVSGSGLTTYRSAYSSWSGGDAKQGNGNQNGWDGSEACWGYCGINAGSFPGSGNINSVSSAQYSGTRGGAGYYNNNQTVYFHRGNKISNGQPTVTGQFTSTTGGPGSGKPISTKTISGGEFKNWLNSVGGNPYLTIYSDKKADYLSLTAITVTASYDYASAAALFVDDGQAVAFNIPEDEYSMQGGGHLYHKMPIYKDEINLTLTEIMDRREQGIVEDIDPTTVNYAPTILPWFREREVFEEDGKTKFKIEAKNMRMEDEAQYSLDNTNWFTLYGTNKGDDYVEAEMPEDFNKYSDFIYARILDKKKEIIMEEAVVEPKIYIPDMTKGIITPGYEIDIDEMLGDDNEFKK